MLTKRDKQAIQLVTRYSDSLIDYAPFEFSVMAFGQVIFRRPGTTSSAWFKPEAADAETIERYIAELAVFAFRRLIKKHANAAKRLIHRDVLVRGDKPHTLRLWELIEENKGVTFDDLTAKV